MALTPFKETITLIFLQNYIDQYSKYGLMARDRPSSLQRFQPKMGVVKYMQSTSKNLHSVSENLHAFSYVFSYVFLYACFASVFLM